MPRQSNGATRPCTRIVVVDDHAGVRVGLERVLRRVPGFSVVAALQDGGRLLDDPAGLAADVVVLDYELTDRDGLALCQRLKHLPAAPRVLIYASDEGQGLLVPAAIAQADAVVGKGEPVGALISAIRRLARGERLLPSPPDELLHAVKARVHPQDAPVIPMLVCGATVPEIATALGVPEGEVLRRARRIIGRLDGGRRRASHVAS